MRDGLRRLKLVGEGLKKYRGIRLPGDPVREGLELTSPQLIYLNLAVYVHSF